MEPPRAFRTTLRRVVPVLRTVRRSIVAAPVVWSTIGWPRLSARTTAALTAGLLAVALPAAGALQAVPFTHPDFQATAQAEERSDRDIRRDVVQALRDEPELNVGDIRVEVEDGRVVLSGSVPKWKDRQLAEEAARNVEGVRAVANELRTEDDADRPDDEIRAEIIRNLQDDPQVDASTIEVKVVDGGVTLRGTVGSVAEKDRAYGAASVQGVASVDTTHLEIREERHRPARAR